MERHRRGQSTRRRNRSAAIDPGTGGQIGRFHEDSEQITIERRGWELKTASWNLGCSASTCRTTPDRSRCGRAVRGFSNPREGDFPSTRMGRCRLVTTLERSTTAWTPFGLFVLPKVIDFLTSAGIFPASRYGRGRAVFIAHSRLSDGLYNARCSS